MKYLFIYLFYFSFYITFEVIFNAIARAVNWYDVIKDGSPKSSLKGYASIYIGIIGGIVGLTSYLIFDVQFFAENYWTVFLYMAVVTFIIVTTELNAGVLLNRLLKLDIWNYENEPFNFYGQISLFRSIGWFVLSYFVYNLNLWINYIMRWENESIWST